MAICQSYTGAWFPALSTSMIRICYLVTLILCSPTSTADELEGLSVTAMDGEYSLRVAVVLNAPVDYVYKVITDYKNAYLINPAITAVEILPSGRNKVVRVRNLSEQCIGPICFHVVWTGDIVETSDRDIKVTTIPELSDFVSGSAIWRVRAQGEHTRVLYESRMKLAFFVPPVIGGIIIKRHIKDETLDTFRRIESQAMTMLDLDKKQQAEDLKKLSKEGPVLLPLSVALGSMVADPSAVH
jgi:uncharacterized membrane protein